MAITSWLICYINLKLVNLSVFGSKESCQYLNAYLRYWKNLYMLSGYIIISNIFNIQNYCCYIVVDLLLSCLHGSLAFSGLLASFDYEQKQITGTCVRKKTSYYAFTKSCINLTTLVASASQVYLTSKFMLFFLFFFMY